jgi:dolichol-phosphate mannosyltransferase
LADVAGQPATIASDGSRDFVGNIAVTSSGKAAETTGVATVSIVVPTFNEAGNVALLVKKIETVLAGEAWEIVFVDDDSTDGTVTELHALCRAYRNIRMIQRIGRRGLSSAVVEGILSTSSPYVAVMDADLQHDERLLPEMLANLRSGEADLVIGSRYLEGASTGDWEPHRIRLSRIATYLSKFIVSVACTDALSGFFMIRRSAFDQSVRNLSAEGFKILLDILASSPAAPRVKELPYTFGLRQYGDSKLDALVTFEYVNLLLAKLFGRWLPTRFIIFSAVGGLGVLVHLSVLTVLHFAGAPFVYGQGLATLVAMTFNFFMNNLLTYRDRRIRGTWPLLLGLLSFYAVCSLGAVANVGIANVFFERKYAWWLSGIAGIAIGAVWNFAATSIVTWRRNQ